MTELIKNKFAKNSPGCGQMPQKENVRELKGAPKSIGGKCAE